jgi:predicted RNase H-like HicB family nuclease
MRKITVLADWDAEAEVWVATSDDVPGLATEASSIDELVPKLKVMVPELLALNGFAEEIDHHQVPIELCSRLEFNSCALA